MRSTTTPRTAPPRRFRGTAILEFLFVIPIMIILIGFIVDLGLMLYTKNVLADATQASVRVASQRGGAVINGRRVAQDAFYASVEATPGLSRDQVASYTVGPNTCTNTNSNIQATVEYEHRFVTPGVNALLDMIGSRGVGERFSLRASSSLRCEIAWSN